jgi:hypothetical protein
MTDRRVTQTSKDSDGDITGLCGSFGSVTTSRAITDIEDKINTYYVQDYLARRADIEVVNGPTRKYLRTDPNSNCSDNLDSLPDC